METANRDAVGIVFNIQKFSVNDGPGIRTVVFLKGCPLRCRWCANPESQLIQPQVLHDEKKCLGCRRCEAACGQGAISWDDGRFSLDHSRCTGCADCLKDCAGKALTLEGGRKSVAQVMETVMQDLPFYEESGGGVTLSGGEVLSQPDFARQLLLAAKEEGLHSCCETTGYAPPEVFEHVAEYADMLLFDMKHWDESAHKTGTGVSNALPLANMAAAIRAGKEVLPRIPVIPGFNDSLKDAAKLAETLKRVGAERCQLLPFHQFGENKYHLLNKAYDYEDVPSLHRDDLEEYLQSFIDKGIDAFF